MTWYKQDFIKQISPFQRALKYHCIFLYEGDIVRCPPPPTKGIYLLSALHAQSKLFNQHFAVFIWHPYWPQVVILIGELDGS